MDDLAGKVDSGFARVASELGEIRGEIGALHRTIIHFGAAMLAGFLGLAAAIIGLIATQL